MQRAGGLQSQGWWWLARHTSSVPRRQLAVLELQRQMRGSQKRWGAGVRRMKSLLARPPRHWQKMRRQLQSCRCASPSRCARPPCMHALLYAPHARQSMRIGRLNGLPHTWLQAQVQQLIADLQKAEERCVVLEAEVREEVADEMAQVGVWVGG